MAIKKNVNFCLKAFQRDKASIHKLLGKIIVAQRITQYLHFILPWLKFPLLSKEFMSNFLVQPKFLSTYLIQLLHYCNKTSHVVCSNNSKGKTIKGGNDRSGLEACSKDKAHTSLPNSDLISLTADQIFAIQESTSMLLHSVPIR